MSLALFFGAAALIDGWQPLAASITPTSWSGTYTDAEIPVDKGFSCVASGGTGSYTYAWTNNVGGTFPFGSTGSSTTIRLNDSGFYSGTITCTVSDGNGNVVDTSSISVQVGTPE